MIVNVSMVDTLNFSNITGEPDEEPPTHQLSEFITVSYQILFLLIGVPLNLKALQETFTNRHTFVRFNTLKLNLVVADLLILLVHAVSESVWIVTFTWNGGVFLCKLVKFIDMFSFIAHANIVVSIATDRAMTIWRVDKFDAGKYRLKVMLILSWLLATLASIPQLVVWTIDTPFPGFTQCATVWEFEEFFIGIQRPTSFEVFYTVAHLVVVFYLPAALMFIAYVFTFIRLRKCQLSRAEKGFVRLERKTTANGYSTTTVNGYTIVTQLLSEEPNVTTPLRMSMGSEGNRQTQPNRRSFRVGDWMNSGNPRIIRQTILIAVCYILCFAPYNICALWRQLAIEDWRSGNYESLLGFLEGPIILNAVIDPILYKIN